MKLLLLKIKDFLLSSNMKALYWSAFGQGVSASLVIVQAQLTEWYPDTWQVVLLGLIIARITKALNK